MSAKALFLAWQDKRTRQWFPVGRLDADVKDPMFSFVYTRGVERAQREAGFSPLIEFPDLEQVYRSRELFALFQHRVMKPGRPDFSEYIKALDLRAEANPIEMLSVNGGYRVTDAFEVFPKIEKRPDGSFRCRFFLHGWRHVPESAQARIDRLEQEEPLYVSLELTNPVTRWGVQILTADYHMVGWAPRYLVDDFVRAAATSPEQCEARVVRVNPLPAPSRQRLLIELSGNWGDHEPMSGPDFQPLVQRSFFDRAGPVPRESR